MEILNAIWDVLNAPISQIQERDLTLLSVVQMAVIMVVALVVARFAGRVTGRLLAAQLKAPEHKAGGAVRAVRVAVLFVGLYVSLTSVGFDLAVLLVPLGGLSVGIGFATQDLARNLISGAITLAESRVKPGERIEVRGVEGVVERVGFRSTTVRLDEGAQVVIANADFLSHPVKIIPHPATAPETATA